MYRTTTLTGVITPIGNFPVSEALMLNHGKSGDRTCAVFQIKALHCVFCLNVYDDKQDGNTTKLAQEK